MKTYKLLFGLLSVAGLFSCTGDDMKEMEGSATRANEINQITATVADYGTTRSELYREDNAIKFRWSYGDKMGIFPDTGDQVCFTIDDSQAGSLTARFDGGGWGLKQSHSYSVYFPYIRDIDLTKESIPMDYTGQVQTGINTYTHLGQYDYLASDAVSPTGSSLSFTMNHLGSIILLKLKATEAGNFTYMTLSAGNEVFTSKAELNIAGGTPVVTAAEKSNSMTLQLQDVTTSSANEEFTLSMMTLPVDLSAETLKVFLTRDDGKLFSGYIDEPKNIEQGKPYEMTASLSIGGAVSDDWIEFADAGVKAICVANWDTNGDGELSYKEASVVTDIGNKFLGKTKIKSFDEFQYFTGLQSVPERTFQACIALESITLPNSLTSTSSYMFNGCTSLTSITLPDGLTSIEGSTFSGCSNLTSITLPDGLTTISDHAFNGCSSLTSITLPEGVTTISGWAFQGCSSLTNIIIPDGITEIEWGVFSGCSGLTSITLPDGLTSIVYDAFLNCSSLTSITLPEGLTGIGSSAFRNCSSLTSITIPYGVTSIEGSTFSGCSSLTSITLPDGLTTISDHVFQACSSLTSITLPDGITSIEGGAFEDCRNLTSITIPDGVTSIGDYAFNGCSSLTSITLPDGLTSIGDGAFGGCSSLTSITIPDGVTSIGGGAFGGCSGLTSITLSDGLTSISDNAFNGCTSLTSITIPDGVTSIGGDAFQGCSSLSSITIPDGVTSIGGWTFQGCSSLTSITIPDGVTSIGDWTFQGCSSLTSITLPDGLTSIGDGAFSDCSGLTSITCLAQNPPIKNWLGCDVPIYVPAESVNAYKEAWPDCAERIFAIGSAGGTVISNPDIQGGW